MRHRSPLALVLIGACAVVGCRGASQAQRDAQAAARIRAGQAAAIARQAGLGPDVQAFLASAAGASGATYTVVYDQGGGQSTTVMARPPDRRIDVVGMSGPGSTDRVIILGSDTVVCHLAGATWACVSGVVSAPGGPFTPDAIGQTIASLTQLSQTYDFAVTQRAMLGLDATCLAVTRRAGAAADAALGERGELCLAPSGVILRVADSGTPLQATSYRGTVPSGAFDLPARPTPAVTSTSAPPSAP